MERPGNASRRLKITLIHHPTVALHISKFSDEFATFQASGILLGNVYRRVIPQSLAQVAGVLERELDADVQIIDLRMLDPDRDTVEKERDWDGYTIQTRWVGARLSRVDAAVEASDWIGLSSHFTYESGVVARLIGHVKRVKPAVLIAVGGADVRARPQDYLRMGADLAFRGDFRPEELTSNALLPREVPEYRHPFSQLTKPAFHKLPHLAEYSDSHDGRVPEGVTHPVAFAYLTRGCPRECDFCESRRTKFEMLPLESCIGLLEHYRAAGIRTINFADDNLLLRAATQRGRREFLELLKIMRDLGFAWEFPNGLEIGRFVTDESSLDEELLEAMFSHQRLADGRIVGAYRLYAPIESFDQRSLLKKLKPIEAQNRVLSWLASSGLQEINFGVVLPPDATHQTFRAIEDGYTSIKQLLSGSSISARYGIFHLIPISLFRDMPTRYSVDDFPEGWNFYFPIYDGKTFNARQLFENRLRVMRRIDRANFESLKHGKYTYARATAEA